MNSKAAFALLTCLVLSSSAGVALAQPACDVDATRPVELVPTRTTTFAIEGMSCGRCATSISEKLNEVEGVIHAEVSYDERRARVQYDPERVTEARLMEVIREAGFRVSVGEAS